LQAKFKYTCIEQNRKYLYSVVITNTGRKSNLQRNHWWYSTQHRNIELYSCISFESRQIFKGIFYIKQINFITEGPFGAEGPGQLPPLPPVNPVLYLTVTLFQGKKTFFAEATKPRCVRSVGYW